MAPEDRQKVLEQTGFSDFMLEAFYNANKPAASKIDYQYKIQGDKLVAYGVDPKTGKLSYVDQDLPAEFKDKSYTGFTVTPDGTPLFYDTQTGKAMVAPGFTEGQFAKPEKAGGTGGSSGLDKLLSGYPSDFKTYVKSISDKVDYNINTSSLSDLYQQFSDLKSKGQLPFGVRTPTAITAENAVNVKLTNQKIGDAGSYDQQMQLYNQILNDPTVPDGVKKGLTKPVQRTK